MDPKNGKIKF